MVSEDSSPVLPPRSSSSTITCITSSAELLITWRAELSPVPDLTEYQTLLVLTLNLFISYGGKFVGIRAGS